jgi:diacylglycerol kinase family enzyme
MVVIAANPYSGAGPNRRLVDGLTADLGRLGLSAVLAWDPAARQALLRDEALRRRCCCVVAAGGDGTVADVINERAGLPLAVLPLGTENLFARSHGFPRDAQALARAIAAGRTRRIDLGVARGPVTERRFTLMVSAGLDAEVVHRVAAWRSQGRGLRRAHQAAYVRPFLESLRCYAFPQIEVEADGIRVVGTQALIFNTPAYARGLPFAPSARPDDGLLDWVVFERMGRGGALGALAAVACRRHLLRPYVRHGRARHVVFRAATPVPVQADGDALGFTPIETTVEPLGLGLLDARCGR